MLTKLFAFFTIIGILYTGAIFVIPEITDTYGMKSWNNTVRWFKSNLDADRAHFSSGSTLMDSLTDIAKPYIDESKSVTRQVQETVNTKATQVKQAADSVGKAYEAVEWAKKDVQKVIEFGTGSK